MTNYTWEFKRIVQSNTTVLTTDLHQSDAYANIANVSILSVPVPSSNNPGIVYINGEKIVFYSINGNSLGQMRRGAWGTGVPLVHPAGTLVVDASSRQNIEGNI